MVATSASSFSCVHVVLGFDASEVFDVWSSAAVEFVPVWPSVPFEIASACSPAPLDFAAALSPAAAIAGAIVCGAEWAVAAAGVGAALLEDADGTPLQVAQRTAHVTNEEID